MLGDSDIEARPTALVEIGGIESVKQAVRVDSRSLVPCRMNPTIRPVFRKLVLALSQTRSLSIFESSLFISAENAIWISSSMNRSA